MRMRVCGFILVAAFFDCVVCFAQPSTEDEPVINLQDTVVADDDFGGLVVSNSGVGYIDNAILGDQVWFRFDAAYNATEPARAEFIWPVDGPFGPGPGPETSVDYQDFSAYAERQLNCRWSVFGELPVRMLNPEIQDNTAGIGDINVGFKRLLCSSCDTVKTLQLRTYVPTADGSRGLGTRHVSLEPAFLFYHRRSDWFAIQGEVRDWFSIGGSDGFAGNVLRYGLGGVYTFNPCDCRPVSAVAEIVGWTVLHGGTAITTLPTTLFTDAAGDTIVNAKFGLRVSLNDQDSIYAGYGHALTDETWYEDVIRLEFRRAF
jgi:hypothetical protein